MRPTVRPMLQALAAVAILALAGCGSSSPAGNPLNTSLSYFPANSPFVISIQTDPNSPAIQQMHQLEGRFPTAALGQAALMAQLQQLGINYDTDIRPLFGNPVLLGLGGPGLGGGARSEFLAVWITKDAGTLSRLVSKLTHGGQSAGKYDGATLYQAGTSAVAVDGATAVIGASTSIIQTALDRHAHGGGVTPASYASYMSGLPRDTLMQAFGSLTGALSTPRAAKARQIPWVAALRGYGAAISAGAGGLTLRYHLDTSGGTLSTSQLPIASGTTAPPLAGSLPIAAAVANPSQLISFIESAEQATGSPSYADFLRRQAAAKSKTGADLNTLLGQMTGSMMLSSDTHTTMVRAGVTSPSTTAATLAKLARDPQAFSATASSVTKGPGGFYTVNDSPKKTISIGLIGNQLIAGRATPAALSAFAAAPTSPAAGANGTLAFRIALPTLLGLAIRTAPPKVLQTVLGQLGAVTGWAAASTTGLSGAASLALQ